MPQQVQLNTDKCEVISIHHQKYSNTGVEEVVEIKDLGVYLHSLLLFDNYISEKVKSTHDAGCY